MAASVGEGKQWMSLTLTLARLSMQSPAAFLYPSWDVMVWIGGLLDVWENWPDHVVVSGLYFT